MKHCAECGALLDGPPPVRKCQQCGATNYDGPVAVALVLVHDGDGQILMTRQPSWPADWWALVSGFVDHGETAEQAALREVKEETGLDVEIESFLGTFTRPYMKGRLMIGYKARAVGGELRPGDDVSEVRWVEAHAAPIFPGAPMAVMIASFLDGWRDRLQQQGEA